MRKLPFLGSANTGETVRRYVLEASAYGTRIPGMVRGALSEFAISATIFIFTAFYVLIDAEVIATYLRSKIPPRYAELRAALETNVKGVMYGAIYSTFLTQALKSAILLVIFLALRIPLAVVPLFVAEYPLANYPSPSIALGALGTDGIFACNARLSAQLLSTRVPTFEYEFNDANAPQRFLPPASFPYGAYHAAEIQYLFGLRAEISAPALNAAQEELSDNMVRYWTQFARSGNPNSPDTPPFWPSYETATDQIQSLVPPTPQTQGWDAGS